MPFPVVPDEPSFDAFMDNGPVQEVLDWVTTELGCAPVVRARRGSVLVGLGETEVLKVFPPLDEAHAHTERACLGALHRHLPLPTPELLDSGVLHGWSWIRMSRLPGTELVEAWDTLGEGERRILATQLGEGLAALHQLEAPAAVPRADWRSWCAERIPLAAERQRERGCPEALVEQIPGFLADVDVTSGATGWLHTEVMREHLVVEQTPAGPRLSGLFDFEPSWVGPVHYEFASVGVFFSAGDPALLGEVLRAAGMSIEPRRLLAMALLHRYSNLAWYHRRLGGPLDLEALASAWFGTT